jgi:D-sedoheptulose 7-phosphate isomerase
MDYKSYIETYFFRLKNTIEKISFESINEVINILAKAKNENHTIFIMGNGGSASTASHFACDFNKGLSFPNQKRYKFICLNDNVPTMMAYGNDISYDDIFVEQLKNFFQPGDVVIGISSSGNSANVIKAIEYANKNNGITIALTGFNGGKIFSYANHNINIPVNDVQIAEDLHMVLDHCMMKVLTTVNTEKYAKL